jgi:hypothetical protein
MLYRIYILHMADDGLPPDDPPVPPPPPPPSGDSDNG